MDNEIQPSVQTATPTTLNQPIPQQTEPTTQFNSQTKSQSENKPSTRIQIVGILIIISSTIMIFAFLLSLLMVFGDGNSSIFIPGILALLFGISGIFVGSGIRSLKKWAWYAGVIALTLATIGNLVALVTNFQIFISIPILLEAFSIYSLFSERNKFLSPD